MLYQLGVHIRAKKIIQYSYAAFEESLVEGSHVEVQPLVNKGPDLWVCWVERAVFGAVGVDEVKGSSAALTDDKVAIHKDWNGVLRIQLK